ncbi:DUF4142 domain-containing protein [Roseixanthobacter glucoisosaccharinicivorans]|uniref:DUF4142 domain-containing protein n=1 Tax=Roseixanthobacter glucoisosaccharinicivorans TaxID=3119923 RepID=UPI003728CA6D
MLAPALAQAQLAGTLSGPKFVEAAAIADRFEIEAGRLALEKTESPQIKILATRLVADHTHALAGLKAAAAKADGQIVVPGSLDTKHEAKIEQLKAATGADFDTLFVQMQTRAHEAAIGIFASFAKEGDQTVLKDYAGQTLPVLERHLEEIRQIQIRT